MIKSMSGLIFRLSCSGCVSRNTSSLYVLSLVCFKPGAYRGKMPEGLIFFSTESAYEIYCWVSFELEIAKAVESCYC